MTLTPCGYGYDMGEPGRLLQVYEVSDALTQELIFSLLSGRPVSAWMRLGSGHDTFLVVECANDEQGWGVHQFVTAADSGATLIHASVKQSNPGIRRVA